MIVIDPESAVAPFEQLRVQIIDAVADGRLPVGDRLPTVRKLAADLQLAPGTVARAYRELETSGIIETRGRNGTFIRAHGDATLQHVQQAAAAFADAVRAVKADPLEALDVVRVALRL